MHDADTYANADTYPDANANANAYANPNANAYANPDADTNTNPDADADADPHADHRPRGDVRADLEFQRSERVQPAPRGDVRADLEFQRSERVQPAPRGVQPGCRRSHRVGVARDARRDGLPHAVDRRARLGAPARGGRRVAGLESLA